VHINLFFTKIDKNLAEIESFPDKEIAINDIDKNAYRETLDYTKDTDNNWKKLIRDNEKE